MARSKTYKNPGGRRIFGFAAHRPLVVEAGATVETEYAHEQKALKAAGFDEVKGVGRPPKGD